MDQYTAATINRRLAAICGLFTFVAMRDPDASNPVPNGREARWRVAGERSGMLAHAVRRPKNRSSLRLREPRRLPTALSQAEAAELLASFRTWRDRAIAGTMLYCGLPFAEALVGKQSTLHRANTTAVRRTVLAQLLQLTLKVLEPDGRPG